MPDHYFVSHDEEKDCFVIRSDVHVVSLSEVRALLIACQSHIEKWTDQEAAEFNEKMDSEEALEQPRETLRESEEPCVGYVYLCRSGRSGLTKIGYSAQPELRESTLQAEDPMLKMVAKFKDKNRQDEKWLHRIFSDKRRRGEWFSLSRKDIKTIKAMMHGDLFGSCLT